MQQGVFPCCIFVCFDLTIKNSLLDSYIVAIDIRHESCKHLAGVDVNSVIKQGYVKNIIRVNGENWQ